MLILLALIFGAAAGTALHFVLPGRAERGTAVAPLLTTALAGLFYTALTWAGLAESNPWLWVVSLLAPPAVTLVAVVAVSRARKTHDENERTRLRIP